MNKFLTGAAVVALSAVAVLVPDAAFATTLKTSIDSAGTQMTSLPIYINYASYIMGTVMGVTGISSLKKHVDNPGQEPLKNGLGRLGAAGLFIALPSVLTIMSNTNKTTGGTVAFTGIAAMT